ncbi:lysylphosphatidylglycerol synthase transmembrane domain-containing protein [Dactylosporangium sp. CA-139114]|uniref:lysylphosphatidylglycerol synthase transmembrane domain-containing protein n=1 Tax=Dactylosporangium sp. CA-139114 TaxID=3239931 RepID=UPI003D9665A9
MSASTKPELAPPAPPRRRRRRWVRLAVIGLIAVVLATIGLHGRLPSPQDILGALGGAKYSWIALAALLQVVSIESFALQQRRLLNSLGAHLTRGHVMAITLAGTALSISMPAGPAVSTAFTIREYQRGGATREASAASAIVSGLASIGGLALLYAGGGLALLARNPDGLLSWRPLVVVVGMAALTTALVLAGRRFARRPAPAPDALPTAGNRVTRALQNLLRAAGDAWRAGAGLRASDWVFALVYATVKWLADLLCLVAVAEALHLQVGVATMATVYLTVQIVRQVPLTPGGVGVVETALIAGLTAAGATGVGAAAAVLVYRVLSCWALIPIGGIAAVVLRRQRGRESA